MDETIEHLVRCAQAGDRAALTKVVRASQDRIYNLALRMLADPTAAEDATQDILILLVTKLGSFRGDSRFNTWSYRVAVNHLLTARKIRASDPGLSFDMFRADLENGLVDDTAVEASDHVMLNELRIACTMAMMLCLDMKHRVAYVLGDILELSHNEAAEIAEIPSATYRKRLSRARAEVTQFTARTCGVVANGAACSCPRRLPAAVAQGRVGHGAFGGHDPDYDTALQQVDRVTGALKTMKAQQAISRFSAPRDFAAHLDKILTV